MRLFTRIPAWIRNKYFISSAAFLIILVFLDRNDLFTQFARARELRDLRQSRLYYVTQIASERKELEGLKNEPATLERYAREKYLMKRDEEELFIVPEKPEEAKK